MLAGPDRGRDLLATNLLGNGIDIQVCVTSGEKYENIMLLFLEIRRRLGERS